MKCSGVDDTGSSIMTHEYPCPPDRTSDVYGASHELAALDRGERLPVTAPVTKQDQRDGHMRASRTCRRTEVRELWDGRVAVLIVAEHPDDPHPWILKVESVAVFEPRAGAMRRVFACDPRFDALVAARSNSQRSST